MYINNRQAINGEDRIIEAHLHEKIQQNNPDSETIQIKNSPVLPNNSVGRSINSKSGLTVDGVINNSTKEFQNYHQNNGIGNMLNFNGGPVPIVRNRSLNSNGIPAGGVNYYGQFTGQGTGINAKISNS